MTSRHRGRATPAEWHKQARFRLSGSFGVTSRWSAPAALLLILASVSVTPVAGAQSGDGTGSRAGAEPPVEFTAQERARIFSHSPLPLPPPDATNAVADDPRAARLGQMLFFETRLSSDGSVACSTCHNPGEGLADRKQRAQGLGQMPRHTPSLWNAAYNRWFFWDGRADTLWSQALQPIENPLEMGGSRLQTVRLIQADAALRSAFEELFGPLPDLSDLERFPAAARPTPDDPQHPHGLAWARMSPVDRELVNRLVAQVCKALAAYQRLLLSRRAPFDVFVEGLREGDASKLTAISPEAQRGLKIFVGVGNCRLCHVGPHFSDGEFHNVRAPALDGELPTDAGRFVGIERLLADPFNAAGAYSDDRDGPQASRLRFLARKPADAGLFKTPTLRNIAHTPPYMHQGQFATLERVVAHYSTFEGAAPAGHHQQDPFLKPINLSPEQATELVAFLKTLSDVEIDPALLRPPTGQRRDP